MEIVKPPISQQLIFRTLFQGVGRGNVLDRFHLQKRVHQTHDSELVTGKCICGKGKSLLGEKQVHYLKMFNSE